MPLISSKTKKNLVVGAGLSGAVMAERLASILGEDVLVIDKAKSLAGLAFDYKENDINIHKFGSHIFHTNHDFIWKYLNRFSKFNICSHRVKTFVEGQFVDIPFNLNSLYQIFPKTLAKKIEGKLLKKYAYGAVVPLFEFKTNPFFFDKDLDFLAGYVFQNIFEGIYKKRKNSAFDVQKAFIAEKVSISLTKDERFYKSKYQGLPAFGYTKLIENMLSHKNIRTLLDTNFQTVDIEGFDRVFYTGPIDEFFNFKYGMLNYRSALFQFEELNVEQYQNAGVTVYPNDYDFIKIHEFKHFKASQMHNSGPFQQRDPRPLYPQRTIISKEYPTDFTSGKNERLYPVLDEKNLKMFNKYKAEAKKLENIYFFGRLGDFKYYSMDSAIKRALELFDSVKFKAAIEFCNEQNSENILNRV